MSIYNIYHPRANKIARQVRGRPSFGPHYRYEKVVNDEHNQFDAVDVMNLNHRVDTRYGGDYGKYYNTLTESPKSREGQLLQYIAGDNW